MLPLSVDSAAGRPLRLLAIGAHPDDIEIGCCGTILKLLDEKILSAICWVVLSGKGERAEEARSSAEALLAGVQEKKLMVCDFRDGFFPYDGAGIKEFFESLKQEFSPDLVLTHQRGDLHQDHRVSCELTWNTFRDHLILEYEVPKYDGDMGSPNMFVTLEDQICSRKIDHLMTHFASQRPKRWFKDDLFSGLLRLRGMECNSPTSFAEAFYARKARLG